MRACVCPYFPLSPSAPISPPQTLVASGVVQAVKLFVQHPHPLVADQAQRVLSLWREATIQQTRTLLDPLYPQEPVDILNAQIAAGEVTFPPGT